MTLMFKLQHDLLICYNENNQRPDRFSKQKGNKGEGLSYTYIKKSVMKNHSVAEASCVSRLTENKGDKKAR